LTGSLTEIVELQDRKEAAHRVVEYYLSHPKEQSEIRDNWNFGVKWDFPLARALAKEADRRAVIRNVVTALGYASIVDFGPDWRDHIILLCLCWHALDSIKEPAQPLFERLAVASSENGATRFREFLQREDSDRQLGQFGWKMIRTEQGLEFCPK